MLWQVCSPFPVGEKMPSIQRLNWEKALELKRMGLNEDSEEFKTLFDAIITEEEVSEEEFRRFQTIGQEVIGRVLK
jgi:hypothetical protein